MKEIRVYAALLSVLFVFSCIAGFYIAKENTDMANKMIDQLFSQFKFIKNLSPVLIFLIIFLNNSLKALAAMLAGFLLGIFPILFVMLNGYLIGLVIYVKGVDVGFEKIVLMLMPHGVLEIPAIIAACSYGVWLGKRFWNAIHGRESFREAILFALKNYVKVVLPMLLIAALIETFVTPYIAFALNMAQ